MAHAFDCDLHTAVETLRLAPGDILLRRSVRGRNFSRVMQIDVKNDRVLLDDTLAVGRFWKNGGELIREQARKVDIMYVIREVNCPPSVAGVTTR